MEKVFRNSSVTFKIGIAITIFFSAVIGFFNIAVLYWFGIPILGLIIGIITVWFSRENVKTKILSTLVPVPVILLSFSLFYALSPEAEAETILIPQNFRGQFAIIFDQSCGQPLPYEKGRRIYRIPDSGILITDAKQTFGICIINFLLVDDNGNEIELPKFHRSKFEEEQKDWHWIFSKSKLSKDLVGIFWAYTNRFSFVVSDYRSLEIKNIETIEAERKAFENRIETALKQCHQTL